MEDNNLGMELDHTENFLETSIDSKKVTEVVKDFSTSKFMEEMKNFVNNRKVEKQLKVQKRTVKSVCSKLFCNTKDDTTEYFTSYDDHLNLLDIEIEDQKAALLRGLERLKLLEEKKIKIAEEASKVTSENWILPYNTEELGEHFTQLLKEHLLKKHPDLVGDFYGEHKYTGHARKPNLQYIYDKSGNLRTVRCMDCYLKALKECENIRIFAPRKDEGELSLHSKVGGKD